MPYIWLVIYMTFIALWVFTAIFVAGISGWFFIVTAMLVGYSCAALAGLIVSLFAPRQDW